MPLRDSSHRGSGKLKGLVPAYSLPPRIAIALRPTSPKWMRQPVRVIYQFRRGASLRAKRLPGWVRGVRLERDETTILDDRDVAAACDTQSAIARDLLCAALKSHGVELLLPSCREDAPILALSPTL